MEQAPGPRWGGRAKTSPNYVAPQAPPPEGARGSASPGWGSLWQAPAVQEREPWPARLRVASPTILAALVAGLCAVPWAGAWALLLGPSLGLGLWVAGRWSRSAALVDPVVAEGADPALWFWEPDAGRAWFSPRWTALFDLPGGGAADLSSWTAALHPQDRAPLERELLALRDGQQSEIRFRFRIDGGVRGWRRAEGRAIVRVDSQGRRRLSGSVADVTERAVAEEVLTRTAFTDALTELPNRPAFLERVAHALARARRVPQAGFAVLLLDLDRFQVLNDSLGHAAGDALLVDVGRRLRACLRPGDVVARLSGDEFAVLVELNGAPELWSSVADRIQESLRPVFVVEGQEWTLSHSIGVVRSSEGYERAADLLRDAETAMYRAKKLPDRRRIVFDRGMHEAVVHRLRIDADLRRGVELKEFVLYYQPIVDASSGDVQGFEALVRWCQPSRGLVPPDEFIPVAEESGLIVPIGQWVAEEAVRTLAEVRRADPRWHALVMNINVSARQLREPALVDQLRTAILAAGVPAAAVKLELTESMMIESGQVARATIESMRAQGFRVALDDFGTGYSSLAYLHRFPLDTIKIDKQFVRGLTEAESSERVVRTIVDLARSLGVPVTAEGVETAAQLEVLRALGCDQAQGWLFGRPMPHSEVLDFLRRKWADKA